MAGLLVLGVLLTLALPARTATRNQVRTAQSHEDEPGRWSVKEGSRTVFRFAGFGDRVLVTNQPAFDFGFQDFTVQAWIKAYPVASTNTQRILVWLSTRPKSARLLPRNLIRWIAARSMDNDFGVMPIVDKHQPRSTIEAIGFQLYLDHGRLACQLAAPPMRPVGFQNFVSPAPNLHDGRWHHVAVTVRRYSTSGGRLYVDGQRVLTFNPTAQTGDLSNSEPLRIGNHANPSLRCFFKGAIAGVTMEPRALSEAEVEATHGAGRPSR